MKKGFTLIELLIVLVILGVLASLVLPGYTRMVEKAKADQAITYLKTIRTGEKIYYANNLSYTACADAAQIRSRLGAEVTEGNYLFSVTTDVDAPTTFLATGKRKTDNTTITLDHDGTFGGTSHYKP